MNPRAGVCHGKWIRPGIADCFALVENGHSLWEVRREKTKHYTAGPQAEEKTQ